MSIDWSAPIEAVDANGAVTPAKWHWRDEAGDELGVRFVTCDWFGWPFRDGGQPVHKMDRAWTLRNVTPPMTDLSPETVGKLVALVRRMGGNSSIGKPFEEGQPITHSSAHYEDARAIVVELPEPVDEDLAEVRQLVAAAVRYGEIDAGRGGRPWRDFLDGGCDNGDLIGDTLAALKRRALAAGDRS